MPGSRPGTRGPARPQNRATVACVGFGVAGRGGAFLLDATQGEARRSKKYRMYRLHFTRGAAWMSEGAVFFRPMPAGGTGIFRAFNGAATGGDRAWHAAKNPRPSNKVDFRPLAPSRHRAAWPWGQEGLSRGNLGEDRSSSGRQYDAMKSSRSQKCRRPAGTLLIDSGLRGSGFLDEQTSRRHIFDALGAARWVIPDTCVVTGGVMTTVHYFHLHLHGGSLGHSTREEKKPGEEGSRRQIALPAAQVLTRGPDRCAGVCPG